MADAGVVKTIAIGGASVTGTGFPLVSPLVGAVGAFTTGSTTSVNAVRALSQFEIRSLTSHPPTLEELMLRHYGDELAAAGNGNGKRPANRNGNGDER
jgi:hypothetical protein